MADTNLFPDEAKFTPRPAWQVIEAARRQYLTGELVLATNPTTRIYLRDGMIYFAERSTDGALPIRLMMEGVLSRSQLQRGTVIVNGVEHVGRMFDSDPSIDRASVELCTELFTDDVLVGVSNSIVTGYQLTLYKRHSSGIDRWYPHTVPVISRGETAPAPVAPDPVVQAEPERVEEAAEAAVETATAMAAAPAAKNSLDAPPITQAVPVIPATSTTSPGTTPPPPPPITQAIPVTAAMPAPTGAAHAGSADVDTSIIADEVAEAIKRAFAGMGAAL